MILMYSYLIMCMIWMYRLRLYPKFTITISLLIKTQPAGFLSNPAEHGKPPSVDGDFGGYAGF